MYPAEMNKLLKSIIASIFNEFISLREKNQVVESLNQFISTGEWKLSVTVSYRLYYKNVFRTVMLKL